jgi:hypothetical protein
MTNQQHPITLSLEMVEQWADMLSSRSDHAVFSLAAQWGADQELEACCDALNNLNDGFWSEKLRAARRPKPPSLKEQALEQLECIQIDLNKFGMGISTDTIRRALEALPND